MTSAAAAPRVAAARLRRAAAAGLFVFAWAAAGPDRIAEAAGAERAASGGEAVIAFERGALTLDASAAPLADLLQAIGEVVGCEITLVGALEGTVTHSFKGLPVEQAILRLVDGASVAIEYAPPAGPDEMPSVISIHVVAARAAGPASAAPPPGAPPPPAPLSAAIRRQVGDDDPAVRLKAVPELLRSRSPEAPAALGGLLAGDGDAEVRRRAAIALGKLKGPGAVASLSRGLSDDDLSVRLHTVRGLGAVGGEDAIAAVLGALAKDPDPRVRAGAARALVSWDSEATRAALVEASRDADPSVRRTASTVLARWNQRGRDRRAREERRADVPVAAAPRRRLWTWPAR